MRAPQLDLKRVAANFDIKSIGTHNTANGQTHLYEATPKRTALIQDMKASRSTRESAGAETAVPGERRSFRRSPRRNWIVQLRSALTEGWMICAGILVQIQFQPTALQEAQTLVGGIQS